MRRAGEALLLSASDLVGHLDCHHLTVLDLAVANGALKKPTVFDPLLDVLLERGVVHERKYLEHLRATGCQVVEIDRAGEPEVQAEESIDTMRAGADVIVQAVFLRDRWSGRADFLKRVEGESVLGAWSYEVIDTKLARRTKGSTILQLCLYADLLSSIQGRLPEFMHVVAPGSGYEPQSFRTASYSAYYRQAKKGFERFLAERAAEQTYPEPNEHCELCRWRTRCDARRRADDHLCLVAGISKLQISELKRREIGTVVGPMGRFVRKPAIADFDHSRHVTRAKIRVAAGRPANSSSP